MIKKIKVIIKKQQVFINYVISAGISFGLDLTLFTIFTKLLYPIISDSSILLSTIIARIISSFVNYLINRNKVFKNNTNTLCDTKTIVKYYGLVIIQLCVSALSVYLIYKKVEIDATIIKIPIDITIFIVNYFVQKYLIFIGSDNNYET
ncbi:MAG: GtrA family protein [Bacilli bacterium]|nr:GtrA family protein [Bacilli bacterium]MDD4298276.1 GtrA family protein [Bacilli bacterium]MDD4643951.1 GtrA family protein [Bacilli bacterium]